MAKDRDYRQLISSQQWLRLRRGKLSDCPLCERCEELGRLRSATEVHHITPVERGRTKEEKERLCYDYYNLQALCHDCHVKVHTEMGSKTKEGQRRQTDSRLAWIRRRFLQ